MIAVDEIAEPDPETPLEEQVRALEQEVMALRRRLQDAPKRVRTLEERLLETKGQLAQAVSQNEKLSYTLRESREHIAALRPLAARGAPAICANPDLTMYVAGGAAFAAGQVAADYADAGGEVLMLGKPDPAIFAAAIERLGGPARPGGRGLARP